MFSFVLIDHFYELVCIYNFVNSESGARKIPPREK